MNLFRLKEKYILAVLLLATSGFSQNVDPGQPPAKTWRVRQYNEARIDAPLQAPVRLGGVSDTDRNREPDRPGTSRIGVTRKLPLATIDRGQWLSTADGGRVWRLTLNSANAIGLRIRFESFHVGAGEVLVRDTATAAKQTAGPYTADGRNGDGKFWSDVVFSDTVEIDYIPARDDPATAIPFSVSAFTHLWRVGPYQAPGRQQDGSDSGTMTTADTLTGRVVDATAQATVPNTSCFLDATCSLNRADVNAATKSTAYLIIGDHSCTGVLLNAPNRYPLLLTAGHCVSTEEEARELIGIFNLRTQSCGDNFTSAPTDVLLRSLPQVAGISLLASADRPFLTSGGTNSANDSDYALVRLSAFPQSGDTALSGYSIADLAGGTAVTSVSNPDNGFMKAAFGYIVGSAPPASGDFRNAWQVDQTANGRIDDGSSGSGIFDASGRLLGVLSTATSDCVNREGSTPCPTTSTACDVLGRFRAWYTKFSSIYPSIQSLLVSPITTSSLPVNAAVFSYGPDPVVVNGESNLGQVTLTWNASTTPGIAETQIRIGSPSGPLFAQGGAVGSAATGNWVSNNQVFFLHNTTGGARPSFANLIATTTIRFGTGMPVTIAVDTTFSATPNVLAPGVMGQATLRWNLSGVRTAEVHVGSPTGPLFASGAGQGTATTGAWVTPGMTFFLVDTSFGPASASNVASQITITSGADGNGFVNGGVASLVASPNPILLPAGSSLATATLNWNALGVSNAVEIHVGAPNGPMFTYGGATGSATTGAWVTDGMTFYLQNVSGGKPLTPENTLTTVTASVSAQ